MLLKIPERKKKMSDRVKVKIARVEKDDRAIMPISISGFIDGVVPVAGFIVSFDGPGSVPLYLRDADIEKAREAYKRKGRSIAVLATSWEQDKERPSKHPHG
jgi:hypothetical protein